MKFVYAENTDGTQSLIVIRGIFRKRFYQFVPGFGYIELTKEKMPS